MSSYVISQSDTKRLDMYEYVQDSIPFELAYKDAEGTYYDMTGWTLLYEVRLNQTDALPLLSYSNVGGVDGSITISLPSPNPPAPNSAYIPNISFEISAAKTNTLGVGSFYHYLKATDLLGGVNTIFDGRLVLKRR